MQRVEQQRLFPASIIAELKKGLSGLTILGHIAEAQPQETWYGRPTDLYQKLQAEGLDRNPRPLYQAEIINQSSDVSSSAGVLRVYAYYPEGHLEEGYPAVIVPVIEALGTSTNGTQDFRIPFLIDLREPVGKTHIDAFTEKLGEISDNFPAAEAAQIVSLGEQMAKSINAYRDFGIKGLNAIHHWVTAYSTYWEGRGIHLRYADSFGDEADNTAIALMRADGMSHAANTVVIPPPLSFGNGTTLEVVKSDLLEDDQPWRIGFLITVRDPSYHFIMCIDLVQAEKPTQAEPTPTVAEAEPVDPFAKYTWDPNQSSQANLDRFRALGTPSRDQLAKLRLDPHVTGRLEIAPWDAETGQRFRPFMFSENTLFGQIDNTHIVRDAQDNVIGNEPLNNLTPGTLLYKVLLNTREYVVLVYTPEQYVAESEESRLIKSTVNQYITDHFSEPIAIVYRGVNEAIFDTINSVFRDEDPDEIGKRLQQLVANHPRYAANIYEPGYTSDHALNAWNTALQQSHYSYEVLHESYTIEDATLSFFLISDEQHRPHHFAWRIISRTPPQNDAIIEITPHKTDTPPRIQPATPQKVNPRADYTPAPRQVTLAEGDRTEQAKLATIISLELKQEAKPYLELNTLLFAQLAKLRSIDQIAFVMGTLDVILENAKHNDLELRLYGPGQRLLDSVREWHLQVSERNQTSSILADSQHIGLYVVTPWLVYDQNNRPHHLAWQIKSEVPPQVDCMIEAGPHLETTTPTPTATKEASRRTTTGQRSWSNLLSTILAVGGLATGSYLMTPRQPTTAYAAASNAVAAPANPQPQPTAQAIPAPAAVQPPVQANFDQLAVPVGPQPPERTPGQILAQSGLIAPEIVPVIVEASQRANIPPLALAAVGLTESQWSFIIGHGNMIQMVESTFRNRILGDEQRLRWFASLAQLDVPPLTEKLTDEQSAAFKNRLWQIFIGNEQVDPELRIELQTQAASLYLQDAFVKWPDTPGVPPIIQLQTYNGPAYAEANFKAIVNSLGISNENPTEQARQVNEFLLDCILYQKGLPTKHYQITQLTPRGEEREDKITNPDHPFKWTLGSWYVRFRTPEGFNYEVTVGDVQYWTFDWDQILNKPQPGKKKGNPGVIDHWLQLAPNH